MSIRRFPGICTVDAGVFWQECANIKGWRIQYNKTLDYFSPLKPYRLLDPKGHLWLSADKLEELQECLPSLIEELSNRNPLISKDDVREIVRNVIRYAAKKR